MVMTMTNPAEADPGDTWTYLLRAWQETDMPEGWRAEIREEGIVLVPPPGGPHNSIAYQILKQLVRQVPDDWEIHQTSGVGLVELLRLRIPDLVVVERAAVPMTQGMPLDASDVKLAVEIVSPSSTNDDRVVKTGEYARAGIALYLLVDPLDRGGTVTRFMNPRDGVYADIHRTAFGEPVMLPKPFDKIDTSQFQTPG